MFLNSVDNMLQKNGKQKETLIIIEAKSRFFMGKSLFGFSY